MIRRGFSRLIVCGLVSAALLLTGTSLPGRGGRDEYDLVIGSRERGEVLRRIPVEAGDSFFLDYTHSSEKTPIHDAFVVSKAGTIVLTEERFDWYAVGLEFMSREGEAVISLDGNHTRVVLNRVFTALPIRVGWVANQTVTVGALSVALAELVEGGQLLEIWTERRRGGGTHDRQAD